MSNTIPEDNSNANSENEDDVVNQMLSALQAQNAEALEQAIYDDAESSSSDSEYEAVAVDPDMEIGVGEDFVLWNHNQLFDQLARIREMVHSQQFEFITSDSDDDESERFSSVLESLQLQGKLILGSSTDRLDHFNSDPIYHSNCSVSTRHFQLRHQIWCHPPPSEAALKVHFALQNEEASEIARHIDPEVLSQFDDFVYFVYNWFIMKLNHKTGEATIVKSLSYYPQALHVSYGFVACCGSNGQMTVINLFDNNIIFHEDNVSNSTLNNCVHIAFFSNKLHVMCCSNNHAIRVWELMESCIQDVGSVVEEVAINSCHVSPDGKKLVAVGDTADIILYGLKDRQPDETHICSYKKILNFPDGMGDGFSVSWDSTSTLFAVARLTPGLICIWNADTLDLVYVIKPTTSDATCLSVKFFEPEDGVYAQPTTPQNRFSKEVLLAPKKRASMLLFTQRDLTAHLVHLKKKTEQTFSAITHPKLKEHMYKEAQEDTEEKIPGQILPGESDERPLPKSFTRNCRSLSPKIGGATFSSDYAKIFVGYENFIAEYNLKGVKSLMDTSVAYLRQNPDVWSNQRDLIPHDLLEKLEETNEGSLYM